MENFKRLNNWVYTADMPINKLTRTQLRFVGIRNETIPVKGIYYIKDGQLHIDTMIHEAFDGTQLRLK